MTTKSRSISAIIAATAVAISLTGCALLYPNWGTDQNPSTSQSPSESSSASASPTASESSSPTPQKIKAEFNLIEAMPDSATSSVMVVAEVINVVETGGTCTATLTAGSVSKSVTVKAEANASSTQCFPAYVPTAGMPKGTATLVINYSSATAAGSSQPYAVTLP